MDFRITSDPTLVAVRKMVKMQWERDEAKFMGVSDVVLFVSPRKRRLSASSSDVAWCAQPLRRG